MKKPLNRRSRIVTEGTMLISSGSHGAVTD
jgi:hypothetical protein